jgi:PAS domain S-box-containing protein
MSNWLLRDDSGNPFLICGTAIDITERKQAERELRNSQELLEKTFRSLDSAVFILDSEKPPRIVDCNPAAVSIFGYARSRMLGQTTGFLHVNRETILEFQEALYPAVATQGSLSSFEFRMKRKNGQIFPTEHSVLPLKNDEGERIGWVSVVRDFTERKKAEEALRESEERLRVALSAAQMGTWRWDPATNQDTRDASLNLILGLEAVETTQPVEDFLGFVHPQDRDMTNEEIQRAVRERRTYVAEFRIIRPDGTVRWLRDQGKPLCDENNRVLCLTGAVVDITERKRAEEKIKVFSQGIEGAIDGIAITDTKGIITYANPAIERMYGYEEGEMIGKDTITLNADSKIAEQIMSSMIKTGSWKGETLSQKKNKETFPTQLSLSTIRDEKGNLIAMMGSVRDITERKKAEETLRESEEKYRKLFEETTDAVFVADAETGIITDCNRAAAELVGREKSELIGEHQRILHPPGETEGEFSRTFKQHLAGKKGQVLEAQVITKNGQIRDVEIRAGGLQLKGGKRIQGIFRDITERKWAEEEIRRLSFAIEQSIDGIAMAD